MPRNWTTPYHGVSHYTGPLDRRVCAQVTVNDYGSFTEAIVFPPVGHPRFFTDARRETFPTVEEARTWALAQVPGVEAVTR